MEASAQDHRPRRRFGQNFLTDRQVIDRIVQAIDVRPDDTVAEIGPGRGALTEPLIRSGARLHLVELDRDLVALWRPRESARLSVHAADALAFDFRTLAPAAGGLRIVGNLPYNISTPLLFHLLAQGECIRDMHFMLQREVVERLGAAPGGPEYGRLSVMVQYRCEVTPLFEVPPGAFHPPPRVVSAVVRLLPRSFPHGEAIDYRTLERVVRQAFGQRRKTLRNALSGLLDAAALESLDVDPGRRPETLAVREFVAISNAVHAAAAGRD
jgi:16S rRNA (adenine1518-N6/adenine1519-N6)-dimethyltransferase